MAAGQNHDRGRDHLEHDPAIRSHPARMHGERGQAQVASHRDLLFRAAIERDPEEVNPRLIDPLDHEVVAAGIHRHPVSGREPFRCSARDRQPPDLTAFPEEDRLSIHRAGERSRIGNRESIHHSAGLDRGHRDFDGPAPLENLEHDVV